MRWFDKVAETSTTTGTGDITLAGAITGYRAFSSVMDVGDTCFYSITAVDGSGVPTGEWETGFGTYSASNTLTRTTVKASSNAGSAVNFSAGTKHVTLSVVSAALQSLSGKFPGIRGAQITSTTTTTVNAALPSGAQAGDLCLYFAHHGFACTLPTGFTSLDNSTGTGTNGVIGYKVLDSTDISNGYVAGTFAGSYDGNAVLVVMRGNPGTPVLLRAFRGSRSIVPVRAPALAPSKILFAFGGVRADAPVASTLLDALASSQGSGPKSASVFAYSPIEAADVLPCLFYEVISDGAYTAFVTVDRP